MVRWGIASLALAASLVLTGSSASADPTSNPHAFTVLMVCPDRTVQVVVTVDGNGRPDLARPAHVLNSTTMFIATFVTFTDATTGRVVAVFTLGQGEMSGVQGKSETCSGTSPALPGINVAVTGFFTPAGL